MTATEAADALMRHPVVASLPEYVRQAHELLAKSQSQHASQTDDQILPQLSLENLPRDLQLAILSKCSTTDLAAVAVTCSRLRVVAQTDELWRSAAEKAFAWKPALAVAMRDAAVQLEGLRSGSGTGNGIGTGSSTNSGNSETRKLCPVWPGSGGQPDGTEWLLTRAGTRLRLLGVQLRHSELGVPESCLLFCGDLLQLWQEQRPVSGHMDKYMLARVRAEWSPGRKTEHFLKAARIVATLVADAIALQLRAVLSADDPR